MPYQVASLRDMRGMSMKELPVGASPEENVCPCNTAPGGLVSCVCDGKVTRGGNYSRIG